MPRWGEGLDGSTRVPGYRISVTEQTGGRRVKRHTFAVGLEWEDDAGPEWERVTGRVASRRAVQSATDIVNTDPLAPTVALARGVEVTAPALSVILDALAAAGRHRVDLADLKRVVSQLGARISKLPALTPEQRQHAEPALYCEIVARCTNL